MPDRAACALLQRQIVPGVAAGRSRARERVEAPHFLPRRDVERDDEAAAGPGAGGHALDHLVADHERRAAQVEHHAIGGRRAELDLVVPRLLAGARIERDHMQVGRRREHLSAARPRPIFMVELPPAAYARGATSLSGDSIEREHGVRRGLQEHHAVMDQRLGMLSPAPALRARPARGSSHCRG